MRKIAFLAVFVFMAPRAAALPRRIVPEDYLALNSVSDPRLSPDGKITAFVVTSVNAKRTGRVSDIWIVPTDGSAPARQFTTGASSRMPRWSPDGRTVAFLSVRPAINGEVRYAERPQVFVLSMSGGQPRRLTDIENGVESLEWSPEGSRLACVAKTGPHRTSPEQGGSDSRHYTSSNYKFNDTGFYDERRSHLFVVDSETGAAKQITSGEARNDTDPRWSPDGSRILFLAENTDGPAMADNDIYVIAAAGGAMRKVSAFEGSLHDARWSPDGKRIVYSGAPAIEELGRIWIAPETGGKPTVVSKDLDGSPAGLAWPTARDLYFESPTRGENQIFRMDPDTGNIAPVTSGARAVHSADIDPTAGLMVYTANDFTHPGDVYASNLSGAAERRLSDVNRDLLAQIDIQPLERFQFNGADGWPIEGFFVKPAGWAPGARYPMVLTIHGGPSSMFGVDWYLEAQVYAARGWAVLFTNPRGSGGYGQKFQRGVEREWGGKAYQDIMAGVDAILKKYPWIDAGSLGVAGGSYGGFMTNWIITHTNRFKAAVTQRSIVNFTSVEGTRDAAYSHALDFGGDLFQNPEYYWNMSPLKYASQVKTPTLIIHADNDQRVPLEESEQWFRALRHFGVTTEFVIFPRENHNMTRSGEPRHVVESLNWLVYWFARFLNGDAGAVRPNER